MFVNELTEAHLAYDAYPREELLQLSARRTSYTIKRTTRKILLKYGLWNPRIYRSKSTIQSDAGAGVIRGLSPVPVQAHLVNKTKKTQWMVIQSRWINHRNRDCCPQRESYVSAPGMYAQSKKKVNNSTDEMNKWQCDILGISESHRLGIDDYLVNGYKFR